MSEGEDMSTTLDAPLQRPESSRTLDTDATRLPQAAPVAWWAFLGGATLLFALYLMVRWVTSGDFKPVPKGPTPLPTWMLISLRTVEIASMLGFLWVGWH